MIDKQERIFNYGHILRRESTDMRPHWAPRPKTCSVCTTEFTATSPNQRRCPACQKAAEERRIARNNRKLKAKRKAARATAMR